MNAIRLIVGLGNPGAKYEETRHNAGAHFVEAIARQNGATLQAESRFNGLTARITLDSHDVRLLIPTTFMNLSGQAVAPIANFFKITPEEILVAHDELDLPPGIARLKKGGGHGGHNGLRDIIPALGNSKEFYRLRIGIGHPGSAKQVSNYVLSKAPVEERVAADAAIDEALHVLPKIVGGDLTGAQNQLHSFTA